MLGKAPFGHNILRKYQAAFGTLFNELQVERRDANGAVQQTITVPLTFARKEKVLARLEGDPDLDKGAALTMPRMSYEMTSMEYDNTRKLRSSRDHAVRYSNTAGEYKRIFNPVPYDLHFNVYVYAKYQHDGNYIVEQILPFFTPDFPLTIHLIPEFDINVDAPVVCTGMPRMEDTYDGSFKERRSLVWTIPFTMKAYLFGPERVYPIIKFANVSLYDATRHDNIQDAIGNTGAIDRVTVQPGQDANGNPTSNVAVTIPYSQIEKDEVWEYATNIYGSLVPGDIGGNEGE
jgi:hypothetical protein